MKRRVMYFFVFVITSLLIFTLCSHSYHHSDCTTADCNNEETFTHPKILELMSTATSTITTTRQQHPVDETTTTTPAINVSMNHQNNPLLKDVFISIKTTGKYHSTRLPVIFYTWLTTLTPSNVHIVTDRIDNITTYISTQGYVVYNSDCQSKHTHSALACKCGDEFKLYYSDKSTYNWYCHFDDDMYVNTVQLHHLLSPLNYNEDHYLGRWSSSRKTPIKPYIRKPELKSKLKRDSYYFATGAAYCISNSLMMKMEQYVSGVNLMDTAQAIGSPDDMAVGFVIESLLGCDLTDTKGMTSHLNPLFSIPLDQLSLQVTISYGVLKGSKKKVVNLSNGLFNHDEDPTRFYSYHCLLYSKTVSWCSTPGYIPKLIL